nr:restriction endonuclease subunit S [uncultured Desulfobacter sp.]
MTPETFLKKFGCIANAPGGVQRLREMILQLAVMGKLVAQNPEDEPASELLKRVEVEKKEQIKNRQYKINKKIRKIGPDVPYNIPDSWRWVRFADICKFSAGRTPARKESKYWNTGDFPWFSIADLRQGETIVNCKETVSEEAQKKIFKVPPVSKGTLLMSFKLTIGKISIAGVDCFHNEAIISIYPFLKELQSYLFRCLNGFDLNSGNKKAIKGATLNQDSISNILIALPPLGEQKRIVAKVDQLMALCDRLETQQQKRATLVKQARISALDDLSNAQGKKALQTSWKRVQTHLSMLFDHPDDVEDLKKCILQNAVMGKLVPQNPEDEPASDLLKKITKDMVATLKNKRSFAKLRKPESKYYTQMPNGWELLLMEDLLTGSESGWSPKCKNVPRQNDQWGVLKVSAVTWGEYNPNENKSFPPSLEPRLDYEVTSGNFLLSRANTAELVARSVIVPLQSPSKLMLSDKIVRLNFLREDFKEWVNYVNNSIVSRQYYIENATGTSDSMKNVSRQIIHELPIPFPPLLEQKRIVKKIKSLLILCNQLQKQLAKAKTIAEQLAQSIVETITGQSTEKTEKMKAPKSELVSKLKLIKKPGAKVDAPLSAILVKNNEELSAKTLWNTSGLAIDDFYRQLKIEMLKGWIAEPEKAHVRIIDDQGTAQ